MTDTDGLLRDAGGARPASDVDALVASLSKSCKVADSCPECALDRAEAAAALVQLREENARLLADPMNVGWQRAQDAIKDRAAAVSQWKAANQRIAALEVRVEQRDRQIAVYNSGGFADADALAEKFIELTAKIAALEAERDIANDRAETHLADAHSMRDQRDALEKGQK